MTLIAVQNTKLIAQMWMEFINKDDVEGLCAITSDTWTMHGGLPDLPRGAEGIRKLFSSFGPVKQRWQIKDLISEDDKVVVRAVNYCQQDHFYGIKTNGHVQVFSAIFIHHIVDGKIQETWRNADDLGRVLQLGARVLPPISQTPEGKTRTRRVSG